MSRRMSTGTFRTIVAGGALLLLSVGPARAQTRAGAPVTAKRLAQNPLVTTRSSASLGDNINGPTVIRVPAWVKQPLGRYYMYFAHHMGAHIRLAYADSITGPWTIYEPGVVKVADTALYRPQPDPPENLENYYTHVASPEIYVDNEQQRILLWFHGWWTDGTRWPIGEAQAREWAAKNGYGQYSQVAESTDGLRFDIRPTITKASYLRVFRLGGAWYGMSRAGVLRRAAGPLAPFEAGPNPFRETPFTTRLRHVALLERDGVLYVFFTVVGDTPERVMVSTLSTSGDWKDWRLSPATEVLRPEAPYECTNLPNVPSEGGDIKGPAQQIRDPYAVTENGHTYLFYSFCGEQGIAAAELTFP